MSRCRYRRHAVVFTLKLALGLSLVTWLLVSGNFHLEYYSAVLHEGRAYYLLGVALGQLLMLFVPILRWWILTTTAGLHMSLAQATLVTLKGISANLLLPGGLGIDGVRLLHFRHSPRPIMARAISSLVLDRLLGLFGLVVLTMCIGVPYLYAHNSSLGLHYFWFSLVWSLCLATLAIVLVGALPNSTMNWVSHRFPPLGRMLSALGAYRGKYFSLLTGLLLSLVGHLGICLATWCCLYSMGFSSPFLPVVAVVPPIIVARAIPLAPLGLGITDGTAAILFPLFGLSAGAETQMLLRAMVTGLSLACGIAWFVPPQGRDCNSEERFRIANTSGIHA